ncbi:MAG: hypothetical protein WD342_04885 [Verrucomicrobiales bacterium]
MKRTFSKINLALLALLSGAAPLAHAGELSSKSPAPVLDGVHCHPIRPDLLAPIGVMYEHAHPAGGLMFGYRFSWDHDEGMRQGTSKISPEQIFLERAPDGNLYSATPLDMEMSMHMFEIMYAPTDWVTLMLMPMYMEMTMSMRAAPGGGGHGHGGMQGHGGQGAEMTHATRGWGDTVLAAVFPVAESGGHSLLFNLGVSLPTGAVDLKHNGNLTHYMMQLGSGTWDVLPGITYTGHNDQFSWGIQSIATWRAEGENESGYRLGDALDTTAWLATSLSDWLSLSSRVAWHHEGEIARHYNAPHKNSSPPDFQSNYGGDRIDLGLGLNFLVPGGPLAGHRFGVEALAPVHQDVNGIQTNREISIIAGWTFSY